MPKAFILASGSPRRRELLSSLIPEFEVLVSSIDEPFESGETPAENAMRLARDKARAIHQIRPEAIVLGADTVVAIAGEILSKPEDEGDAERMLRLLSGRSHEVITGCCLIDGEREDVFFERTVVTFREISLEEIRTYVQTGEPMDKAGSYAIQGGAAVFAVSIEGSLSNVIGLPLEALSDRLKEQAP